MSDDLRVRSDPGVGSDSRRYRPLLREGTSLCIAAGPIAASGFWWYEVELEAGQLDDGITKGWVAAGDHDGSAWIAYQLDTGAVPDPDDVVELPVPIVEYVAAEINGAPDGGVFVRYRFSVYNWEAFDDLVWDESSDDGPCGEGAGRIVVRILDLDGGQMNAFCGFSDPYELTDIWFEWPIGEAPPLIQVEIWDLWTGQLGSSSPMQIESPYSSFESPTP